MKIIRISVSLLIMLWLIPLMQLIEINAINTGFSVEELDETARNTFISNVDLSIIKEEPQKKPIKCFDVNKKGLIAIGQKGQQSKIICIYSSDGEFLYGYTFNSSGDFGVEWDEETLNVYFVRSDVIISLDSNGNILDIKKVQNTINNNAYTNDLLYSTDRSVGETTYLIKNDMGILNLFAPSYSQIIVKNSTGAENIIYNVNSMQLYSMIVTMVIIFVFVAIAVIAITRQFIKKSHNN